MPPASLSAPPFRAEHVGSLVRPAELTLRREAFAGGSCSADDLRTAEDIAIADAVKLLKATGMKTITDGEFRRFWFFEGSFENMSGMTFIPNRPITDFKPYIPHIGFMYAAGLKEAESMYCTGRVGRARPFYTKQFEYLKSIVAPEDVKNIKITMCAPSWYHQRHGSDQTYDLSVYKNDDEYFEDIGKAYREEIAELYALGCRHIQIDDPTLCYFCASSMIDGMEKAAVDHEALLDKYIQAINLCVQDRPRDMVASVHACRGNFTGGVHFCEGGYDRIAVKLFNDLHIDAYYLEYDTERAGDFQALAHLPLNKSVVLGLVTTKSPKLENVSDLIKRVHEAATVISQGIVKRSFEVALNQLSISTQCGFASTWEGNPVTIEDQKNKLRLLVDAARQIWGTERDGTPV